MAVAVVGTRPLHLALSATGGEDEVIVLLAEDYIVQNNRKGQKCAVGLQQDWSVDGDTAGEDYGGCQRGRAW